jgi:hypothetical protein
MSDDKQTIAGFSDYQSSTVRDNWIVQLDRPIDSWLPDAGDFNGNGVRDAGDLDLLSAAVRASSTELRFELYEDGHINDRDRKSWVKYASQTWFGDANLDRQFNSADFVSVFQAGRYESGEEAGWAQGDWNGDGVFTTTDFTLAFQDGGYEQGLRRAALAVPEPSVRLLATLALLMGFGYDRMRSASESDKSLDP